jgi:hypothetical protein
MGRVRSRLATLLLAAALAALALAAPAQAKRHYLRFQVLSVKGEQTATWKDTQASGCGSVSRSGSQTISFESTRPARLRLLRIPRFTRTGKKRGVTYIGENFIHTNWTLSRTFQQSPPPACPPEPAYAAQASDCGTRGPFAVPVDVGWRDGAVTFRGVTDRYPPAYKTCQYDGFHVWDLINSKGRLSQRKLTRRGRPTLHVKVSARLNEPGAESEGSQTTSLTATVTLRRVR